MKSIKKKTRDALISVADYYASPIRAFRHLVIFGGAVLVGYLIFVLAAHPVFDKSHNVECQVYSASCGDTFWPNRGVKQSEVGYMTLDFDDAYLERRFRRDKINEFKDYAQAELNAKRQRLFDARRAALEEAAILVCRYGGDGHTPPLLAGLVLGKNVRVGASVTSQLTCTEKSVGAGIEPTTLAIERADLAQLITWLQARGGISSVGAIDFGDPAICARLESLSGSTAAEAIAILARQGCDEAQTIQGMRNELLTLDYAVSFAFLDGTGAKWILHLIAWSLFGLFANSLAGLMKAVKNNSYNGLIFAFIYPKMLLAPLIAVVVVALVVYGLFTTQLNLANQPMFLVFAFLSGYASEKFNGILQDAAHGILASQKFDQKKLESAMSVARIPYPSPPKLNEKPETVSDFEKNAALAADHAIVTTLADHTSDQTEQDESDAD